jgi:predicted glycoside hydrolase/deacetylase ChbG (UPF0249 family)
VVVRYCIVNGDDFGASRGINRGILAAHHGGVLTSASLMVNTPYTEEAVLSSREAPELSLGLHVNFTNEGGPALVDLGDVEACRVELGRQFDRFLELVGTVPTHVDSHHNVHNRPELLPCFLELARDHGFPLRGHSGVRYFSKFYGQWNGETHPEQISTDSLLAMLAAEFGEGITELSCHPGYVDADFDSPYLAERELELRTLCDSALPVALTQLGIQLIGFRDVPATLANGAG